MTEPVGSPSSLGRRLLVVASLVAIAGAGVGLGGCGRGRQKDAASRQVGAAVQIVNFEFQPPKLTVKAGTRVTWTNQDTAVHSVKDTSPLATPVSPDLAKGDTFSITYDTPGSYGYMCGVHNYMTGSVEVTG